MAFAKGATSAASLGNFVPSENVAADQVQLAGLEDGIEGGDGAIAGLIDWVCLPLKFAQEGSTMDWYTVGYTEMQSPFHFAEVMEGTSGAAGCASTGGVAKARSWAVVVLCAHQALEAL
ncbi:hypothetical protein HPP92_005332 [Vanilla planifolia]|uniref:Uncharacterized protein n=1 Tax=Vanilla planifolia TaxID=51239 RepID=A0A835V8Z5_VANPL|nr:hypothetical protein HPP92_005332 [Vanilla planifolia]